MRRGAGFREVYEMSKYDLTIFRYSTILTLTRAGISTFAELEAMSNTEIANIRGLGLRGYKEILEKLGRNDAVRSTIQGQ